MSQHQTSNRQAKLTRNKKKGERAIKNNILAQSNLRAQLKQHHLLIGVAAFSVKINNYKELKCQILTCSHFSLIIHSLSLSFDISLFLLSLSWNRFPGSHTWVLSRFLLDHVILILVCWFWFVRNEFRMTYVLVWFDTNEWNERGGCNC